MMKNTLKKLIDETTHHHTVEWVSDENPDEVNVQDPTGENGPIIPDEEIEETVAVESFLSELLTTNLENTNVQFRPDTDLGHICQAISSNLSLTLPAGLSEEEQHSTMVEHIDHFLTSEDGIRYFNDIKQYSEIFSEKINDAFDTLKHKVAPEIETLADRVINRANDLYKQTTSLSGINESEYVEPVFTMVNLHQYKTEEAISCAKELVSKYMKNKVDSINANSLRYIVNAIPKLQEVRVDEDDLRRWSNFIVEKVTNSTEPNDKLALDVYNTIVTAFREYEYTKLNELIYNSEMKYGKFNETAIRNASAFLSLKSIYNLLDAVVDLVDDKELEKFKSNMQALEDFRKTAIVLLALASEKYADSVVIGEHMLNYHEFKKLEAQGGTTSDIANHIRLFHNNNEQDMLYSQVMHSEIPANGITVETIMSTIDNTRDKLNKLNNSANTQLQSIANNATKMAVESVLRDYVSDIENNHPEMISGTTPHQFGINTRKLIPTITYNLVRFEKDNIIDALYEFYLKVWYKDSLVSNIYYRLGAAIVDSINSEDTIDNETMKQAHFTVMSDILSEYITKTMIIPSM